MNIACSANNLLKSYLDILYKSDIRSNTYLFYLISKRKKGKPWLLRRNFCMHLCVRESNIGIQRRTSFATVTITLDRYRCLCSIESWMAFHEIPFVIASLKPDPDQANSVNKHEWICFNECGAASTDEPKLTMKTFHFSSVYQKKKFIKFVRIQIALACLIWIRFICN